MAIIHVDVTADDIASGKESDCAHCPVARAIGRALRDINHNLGAEAAYLGITIYSAGRFRRWHVTPPVVVSFWMRDFDMGRVVPPFAFRLEIPDEVIT